VGRGEACGAEAPACGAGRGVWGGRGECGVAAGEMSVGGSTFVSVTNPGVATCAPDDCGAPLARETPADGEAAEIGPAKAGLNGAGSGRPPGLAGAGLNGAGSGRPPDWPGPRSTARGAACGPS
jgi:hypothetical protein